MLKEKGIRKVAVLCAGESEEAEVSRVSSRAVSEALVHAGFEVR
jgi:D-alanine-D-alanine ligase-like ATP-grasp enzyme